MTITQLTGKHTTQAHLQRGPQNTQWDTAASPAPVDPACTPTPLGTTCCSSSTHQPPPQHPKALPVLPLKALSTLIIFFSPKPPGSPLVTPAGTGQPPPEGLADNWGARSTSGVSPVTADDITKVQQHLVSVMSLAVTMETAKGGPGEQHLQGPAFAGDKVLHGPSDPNSDQ